MSAAALILPMLLLCDQAATRASGLCLRLKEARLMSQKQRSGTITCHSDVRSLSGLRAMFLGQHATGRRDDIRFDKQQ